MIIYPDQMQDNSLIDTDVCIIGSGPSGITIALELLNTGRKITIVTGGTEVESVANQELNKGIVLKKGSHEPLEENRRRAFGGASTVWGGRCIPFDPIDFKKRDWIAYSGWPFTFEEVKEYFDKATVICKAGNPNFDALSQFPQAGKEIMPGIDNEEIISSKLERWSTPVNFAKDYKKELSEADHVQVLIDTHLIKFSTENSKDTISAIHCRTQKKNITIKAKTYILACGGIENPRLLLASKNSLHPNGIGNDHDVVGRFYMAHILGTCIALSPKERKNILFNFERDAGGVYCRRRWWITEKAQTKSRIGNIIFFLHKNSNQDGHRDALFSFVFLAKFLQSAVKSGSVKILSQKWNQNKKYLKDHFVVLLKDGWKLIPEVVSLAKKRYQPIRLPFILPSINSTSLGLYFQSEQVPNRESRITISDKEFDSLDIPRAIADIRFSDIDKKTVIEGHKIFVNRYNQNNIGSISFNEEDLLKFIDDRIDNFNSAAHHIGTTRISENPAEGVVDPDCKVHGIKNLYVTGSSVFPTGGHANPTLTIVALAIKLADHLKKQ